MGLMKRTPNRNTIEIIDNLLVTIAHQHAAETAYQVEPECSKVFKRFSGRSISLKKLDNYSHVIVN